MPQKTFHAPPIQIPSEFNSSVDVIIPFHGQYEKVMALLDSIFRMTRTNYYSVCVVDDASPNSAFLQTMQQNAVKHAELRRQPNIFKTIRLPEQVGFAGAARAGFEQTSHPYVCFVNSDCQIDDPNWLRSMGECLLDMKSEGVRMVSPTTDNIVGGHPAQQAERRDRETKTPPVILEEGTHLSLYCFMCHRELFARCGGFLKEYPFGFYEDEEFAARMQHYGFKQAVCRDSWIYHEGSATVKRLWRTNPATRDLMEKGNRERCIADMKKLGSLQS